MVIETMASVPRSQTVRSRSLRVGLLALLACSLWFVCGLAHANVTLLREHRVLARKLGPAKGLRFATELRPDTSPRARRRDAAFASQAQTYLQIAEVGVTRAERLWRNRRLGWVGRPPGGGGSLP